VIVALSLSLISLEQLLALVRERPSHCEIVLTGRGAPRQLIDVADLVTEMLEVKHYYHQGVKAREGIER
jgi:cob(I)alamin adenosyltransferase